MDQTEVLINLLRYKFKKEGITISNAILRDLGNISKATEIPLEDLKEAYKQEVIILLEELFA